jgi:hypothetical protein
VAQVILLQQVHHKEIMAEVLVRALMLMAVLEVVAQVQSAVVVALLQAVTVETVHQIPILVRLSLMLAVVALV